MYRGGCVFYYVYAKVAAVICVYHHFFFFQTFLPFVYAFFVCVSLSMSVCVAKAILMCEEENEK